MEVLLYLIPLALLIGIAWLGVFIWTIRANQYEDLDGAAQRILIDDEPVPAPSAPQPGSVPPSH